MSVCQGVPCALLGALTPLGPRGSRSTATNPAGQHRLPHPKTPHLSAGGAGSPVRTVHPPRPAQPLTYSLSARTMPGMRAGQLLAE